MSHSKKSVLFCLLLAGLLCACPDDDGDVFPDIPVSQRDTGGDGAADSDSDIAAETGVIDLIDADEDIDDADGEEPVFVDWCRLQAPEVVEVVQTDPIDVAGRVLALGVTDVSEGVDEYPYMVAAGGFGPEGSDPRDNPNWIWISGNGTTDWIDTDEPGIDEYEVTINAPSAGTYDIAFRFSLDSGTSWEYCDLDTGVEGEDGSENGYQSDNAGVLTTLPDPCEANPCTSTPPLCDGELTRLTPRFPGVCTRTDSTPSCAYDYDSFDCSLILGTCEVGDCVGGAVTPGEGHLIFTEFMAHSTTGTDRGEWVEIYNPEPEDGQPYNLQGCVLRDEGSDRHEIEDILLILPGEHLVMARSEVLSDNHGLPVVDYVYGGFNLANSEDEIILDCFGTVVDTVVYTNGDLIEFERSTQLGALEYDKDARNINDFCPSADDAGYGTVGKKGTPGAQNRECPIVLVDRCRLVEPFTIDTLHGIDVLALGQVRVAGLTDLTDGLDTADALSAQGGYGALDDDPTSDASAWVWYDADGDSEAIHATDDTYSLMLQAPEPGEYRYAMRFSLDKGRRWTVCDRNTEAAGEDGSEDGFQADRAGTMTVAANPCFPDNPCNPEVPGPFCDETTLVTASGPEDCVPLEGGTSHRCDLPGTSFNCASILATCETDTCVGGAIMPGVGDLIITEFMARSATGSPDLGEWIELHNPEGDGGQPYNLQGCILRDDGSERHTITDIVLVEPGESVVLARSDVAEENYGLPEVDYVYRSVTLSNSEDEIVLECDSGVVASITYTDSVVIAWGRSAQLSGDAYATPTLDNFCLSEGVVYGDADKVGTPGSTNPTCGTPAVDFCRLLEPRVYNVLVGDGISISAEVEEAGITNVQTGCNKHPGVIGEAGYGPSDVSPDDVARGGEWTWVAPEATASGDPARDICSHTFTFDTSGPRAFAFRFTQNGGADWTYCDGGEGSTDGFVLDDAGNVGVFDDPCTPGYCDSTPYTPWCEEEVFLVTPSGEITCESSFDIDTFVAECVFETLTPTDCSVHGGTCTTDSCTGEAPRANTNDVVISEVVYDTVTPLSESDAEWFELTNRSGHRVSVSGCTITDKQGSSHEIERLVLEIGEVTLFARSDVTDENGGIVPDHTFSFSLKNGGDDSLSLTCPDNGTIHSVDFGAEDVPAAVGTSIALDGEQLIASPNDAEWCLGVVPYYLGDEGIDDDHYGTPGELNPPCGVQYCRHVGGPVHPIEGQEISIWGSIEVTGLTDLTMQQDPHRQLVSQVGYGPDGTDPTTVDGGAVWIWHGAGPELTTITELVDEYVGVFAAPAEAGSPYDMAARFSVDYGATWTYCDANGSLDGYNTAMAEGLTTHVDPCDGHSCTPTEPICNETHLERQTGECLVGSGVDYIPIAECETVGPDCADTGATCNGGWCEGGTAPNPLYFSEYVEGSSTNKAMEIYNSSVDQTVDLSDCVVEMYRDGGTGSSETFPLEGSLAPGDVHVLCRTSFDDSNLDRCDQLDGSITYNGNDALALVCDDRVIDFIGQVGAGDPGDEWGSGDTSTKDHTLQRSCDAPAPDRDGRDAFDPADQWIGHPQDHFAELGLPPCIATSACTMTFDGDTCPLNVGEEECGAEFSLWTAGTGCYMGEGNCFDSGDERLDILQTVFEEKALRIDFGTENVRAVEFFLGMAAGEVIVELVDDTEAVQAFVTLTDVCEEGLPLPRHVLIADTPTRYMDIYLGSVNDVAWLDTLTVFRTEE